MEGSFSDAGRAVRVVVGEPHGHRRSYVRAALADARDVEVVGTGGDPDGVALLVQELRPDVAILDVGLLAAGDFPLHGWPPVSREVTLIAVGFDEDPYLARRLRRAGFAAYVPRRRLAAELADRVRAGAAAAR